MTRIKISYLLTFLSKCKQTELQQQQHLKTRQKITKNVSLALVHKKSITSLVHCFFLQKNVTKFNKQKNKHYVTQKWTGGKICSSKC